MSRKPTESQPTEITQPLFGQALSGNLVATITENPVLLGAVGLAVGALLGAFVPRSDQEEVALGGVASQARGAARSLAQEVVDRSGEAAQRALDAGRESARTHGLTPDKTLAELADDVRSGELSGTVKQVAPDMLKAADAGLKKEQDDRPTTTAAEDPAGSAHSSAHARGKAESADGGAEIAA